MKQRRRWQFWGVCGALAVFCAGVAAASAFQEARTQSPAPPGAAGKADKAQAYYHYTLGHLYQERGTLFNRPDLLTKAIDELKLALEFDPGSSFLSMELADLYALTGRFRSALQEAEDAVSRNPDDPAARKLLGRLYLRVLAADRRQQFPPDLQQRAIEQFEQIIQRDPQDASSYLVLAQLYRVNGDNAKAEEILKKAVALDPDSRDTSTQLALLYIDLGQYNAAIELLRKVTAQPNSDPQILTSLGYAYEQIHDYKSAAGVYSRALERDPENLAYRKALGQSLLYDQQYSQALEHFQIVVRSSPRDVEAYLRLSQIYRLQRKFDAARENLDKALDLAPDNQELQYNQVLLAEAEGKPGEAASLVKRMLDASAKGEGASYTPQERSNRAIFLEKLGTLYREQNNSTSAEDAFRQMVALGGEGAVRGEVRLIETYQENRQWDKALREAERASQQFPESRELILTRAALLASTGDADTAGGLLKSLLKNTADDREVWLTLAQVRLRAKQFAEAEKAVSEAELLSPSEEQKAYIQFLYGTVWERQKRYDKAEQAFRKALEFNPDNANALNYLGYMFADRGVQLEEAVGLIQRALELEPNSGAYLDSLGWAYFKQDRLDLAEQYLRQAVERIPTDPTIRDHLGDLYSKTGRLREAQEEWKVALDNWKQVARNEIEPDEIAKIEKKLKDAMGKLAREENEPRR